MLRFEDTFCADSAASDIICTFINNRLIGLLEDRMFLYDEKGYEAIKDNDLDFAEKIEILFPQSYPKEKMTETFLGLYMLLKADDSFVPNLTMEYLLAQLISSQVSLMEDSFQPTTQPVPERAYVLRKLKEECEDDDELAYRIKSIEDMKEYLESCFWDCDYLLLDQMTEGEIAASPINERLGITDNTPENKFVIKPEWYSKEK